MNNNRKTKGEDIPKLLFVHNESGTNRFTVTLDADLPIGTKLCLMEYTIEGIPSVAGVPNDQFYNLSIESPPIPYQHHRNDIFGSGSMPLRLEGPFTTHSYDGANISSGGTTFTFFCGNKSFRQFTLLLTTPTGAAATLSKISLWFQIH